MHQILQGGVRGPYVASCWPVILRVAAFFRFGAAAAAAAAAAPGAAAPGAIIALGLDTVNDEDEDKPHNREKEHQP